MLLNCNPTAAKCVGYEAGVVPFLLQVAKQFAPRTLAIGQEFLGKFPSSRRVMGGLFTAHVLMPFSRNGHDICGFYAFGFHDFYPFVWDAHCAPLETSIRALQ